MLVRKLMKILSNLLGNNSKINASEIAYKNNNQIKLLNDVIKGIEDYLDINSFENITTGSLTSGGTINSINVTIAKNTDGSLAKIYGQIDITPSGNEGNVTFNSSLRPKNNLVTNGIVYRSISNAGNVINNSIEPLTIATDGKITVPYTYASGVSDSCRLSILECLIFINNINF